MVDSVSTTPQPSQEDWFTHLPPLSSRRRRYLTGASIGALAVLLLTTCYPSLWRPHHAGGHGQHQAGAGGAPQAGLVGHAPGGLHGGVGGLLRLNDLDIDGLPVPDDLIGVDDQDDEHAGGPTGGDTGHDDKGGHPNNRLEGLIAGLNPHAPTSPTSGGVGPGSGGPGGSDPGGSGPGGGPSAGPGGGPGPGAPGGSPPKPSSGSPGGPEDPFFPIGGPPDPPGGPDTPPGGPNGPPGGVFEGPGSGPGGGGPSCLLTQGCDGDGPHDPKGPIGGGTGTFSSVTAVPEPSDWLLMLVGSGLAGAALRRRRAQGAARPEARPARV